MRTFANIPFLTPMKVLTATVLVVSFLPLSLVAPAGLVAPVEAAQAGGVPKGQFTRKSFSWTVETIVPGVSMTISTRHGSVEVLLDPGTVVNAPPDRNVGQEAIQQGQKVLVNLNRSPKDEKAVEDAVKKVEKEAEEAAAATQETTTPSTVATTTEPVPTVSTTTESTIATTTETTVTTPTETTATTTTETTVATTTETTVTTTETTATTTTETTVATTTVAPTTESAPSTGSAETTTTPSASTEQKSKTEAAIASVPFRTVTASLVVILQQDERGNLKATRSHKRAFVRSTAGCEQADP